MNIYLIIIVVALVLEFLLYNLSRYLDLRNMAPELPVEFKNYYNNDEYGRSKEYLIENSLFAYLKSSFDLAISLMVIFSGFFNIIDLWIRSFEFSSIVSGLLFFGCLFMLQDVINIPFSIYRTFIIEEGFGFNKTTIKTFILDKIKSYFLVIVFSGFIMTIILYFFENLGAGAWLYAWIIISLFLILIQPLFTLFIAPLFNSFTPLKDGSLKERINDFLKSVKFPIGQIDVMDGSRRSSKSNAYFSGFGKNKRIALFDTLIEKHTENELISIIAHEVGHYKMRHNIKGIILGIVQMGLVFFLLSLFLENVVLFDAFKMKNVSVYAGLLFFSILYSPIDLIMSFFGNFISRKHEFEADKFAKNTTDSVEHLIDGLKKLTVTNLGNLTPHPLSVWLYYSHPPVLQRIKALKKNV